MSFERIQQDDSLYKLVVREIERRIQERTLKPGDRLPNETELARQFGVSRTVIREAIMVLRQADLVEVRHGVGTFVAEQVPERAYEQIAQLLQRQTRSPWEVHEVRCVLEPELAALAAERIDDDQLADLRAIVADMQTATDDIEQFIALDLDFHHAIAAATQNNTFNLILSPVMNVMLENRKLGSSVPGAIPQTLADHVEVLRAIEAGDKDRARAAMTAHLAHVTDNIRAAESVIARGGSDAQVDGA